MTTKVTQLSIAQELDRRKSQTARLLDLFKKEGELTTRDLQKVGTGVSSRIHELRTENHRIVAVREHDGLYRYIYLGQTDPNEKVTE